LRTFHPPRLLSRLAVGKESTPPFPGWGAFYCQNWASTLVEFALVIAAASFFGRLLQDWWIGAKKDIAERAARKGNAQKRRI
tara:strand:+ start:1363 stop:1608 length:246 start_codon:yes stop_codon:yes gene_type:complete